MTTQEKQAAYELGMVTRLVEEGFTEDQITTLTQDKQAGVFSALGRLGKTQLPSWAGTLTKGTAGAAGLGLTGAYGNAHLQNLLAKLNKVDGKQHAIGNAN